MNLKSNPVRKHIYYKIWNFDCEFYFFTLSLGLKLIAFHVQYLNKHSVN